MMEKRVFLAILLSFAVMYGYSFIVPQTQQSAVPKGQQRLSSARKDASSPAVPVTAAAVSVPVGAAPVNGAALRDIVIETELYTAVFTSRGGALKKYVLKRYKETDGSQAKQVALIADEGGDSLTLRTEGKGFNLGTDLVYALEGTGGVIPAGGTGSIVFVGTADGIQIRKKFTFHGSDYGIDLDQQIVNAGTAKIDGSLQTILRNRSEAKPGDLRYEIHGAVTLADNSLHSDAIKDVVKETRKYDKGVVWTGFNDKYFLNSVIALNGSIAGVVIRDGKGYLDTIISSPPLSINPGQSASVSEKIYFGPKDFDILKAQGNRLEDAIDLGWFSAIAKPLLHTLKYFYRYTGNYGVAIIIITIILKMFFFPLTHKSYKSMKGMQKLQPQMAALKEKFKNDRDGMNRAVMELYQTNKVNPIGGCLPMIVQIPVFFALYKALMFSIELRHAPFFLWIQDLSAKDPYYVTPLIMGVTMFVQQKMTPTAGMDPMQAKMMLALPVVFTFMFLNFPSGLVLYWLINNILTIAQQSYINKTVK
jgi:YidC/Oxa1 family membrane protein insertase